MTWFVPKVDMSKVECPKSGIGLIWKGLRWQITLKGWGRVSQKWTKADNDNGCKWLMVNGVMRWHGSSYREVYADESAAQ